MCNTQAYEKGLLEEVTCEHFATWVQPGTFESKVSLVKAHNATKKLRAFLEAENIISSGQTCVTSFACKLSSGAICLPRKMWSCTSQCLAAHCPFLLVKYNSLCSWTTPYWPCWSLWAFCLLVKGQDLCNGGAPRKVCTCCLQKQSLPL